MAGVTPGEASALNAFKRKAREFWGVWESLNRRAELAENASPDLREEYDRVMDRGLRIREAVEKMTSIIDSGGRMVDSTKGWIKDKLGLGGMEDQMLGVVPGLGLIPLIPIATIGISLAAISKWLKDAYVVNKKLALMEKLQRGGMSPGQAAGVVDKAIGSKGFFAGSLKIGTPLIMAAIIGFIYFKKGRL